MTESEVDNAGFTIYRAEGQPSEFTPRSPLIRGSGSSAFRHEYTWHDVEVVPGGRYFYKIETRDHDGTLHMRDEVATVLVPNQFSWRLHPNVPNPFNPWTTFSFEVPEQSEAVLRIHDLNGRTVRTLAFASFQPGLHRVTWDGTDERGIPVGSGVYLVRLVAAGGEVNKVIRVTLLK